MHRAQTSRVAAQVPELSAMASGVLFHLCASTTGLTTTIGVGGLMRRMRKSRRSVQRAIRELEAAKVIHFDTWGKVRRYCIAVPPEGGALRDAPRGALYAQGGRTIRPLGAHPTAPYPVESPVDNPCALPGVPSGRPTAEEDEEASLSIRGWLAKDGHATLADAIRAKRAEA